MQTQKPQKLVKNPKTIAEQSGITSVKDKEREMQAVCETKKRGRPPKVKDESGPQPQVIYVQQVEKPKERKKRVLSDEQKEVLRDRLVKARQAKVDKRSSVPVEA